MLNRKYINICFFIVTFKMLITVMQYKFRFWGLLLHWSAFLSLKHCPNIWERKTS